MLSDRTTTIRASVHDVEFTLMLTIALVVAVIFVFLRSLWATIIPSVTVPLALLGACALMWAVGYSLDNLSLMAFTIAVGFVVDDAIVMLENITRHIEEGEKPFEAALKGSAEIGFTIISISVSLIAVLIPLLMMGGIIGRLFREFSVTIAMTIVGLGPRRADADPDDGLALPQEPRRAAPRPALQHERERVRRAGPRLRTRDRFRPAPPLRDAPDLHRHRRSRPSTCSSIIPKGFFPQQDTGILFGTTEAGQDISFPANVQAAGTGGRDRHGRSRPSTRWRWASAPASAIRRRTTAACSSRSNPATSATSTSSR